MSGQCPYCGGTDIADRMDGRAECLDCARDWTPGGRKKQKSWSRTRSIATHPNSQNVTPPLDDPPSGV